MSRSGHPQVMKIEMTGEGTGPTTEREIPVFEVFEADRSRGDALPWVTPGFFLLAGSGG